MNSIIKILGIIKILIPISMDSVNEIYMDKVQYNFLMRMILVIIMNIQSLTCIEMLV